MLTMLKEPHVTIEKQRGPGAASPLRRARPRLRQATVWRTKISEKAKRKLKEAAGAKTGAEAKKAEAVFTRCMEGEFCEAGGTENP